MKSVNERFGSVKKIGMQEKWTFDLYHNLLVIDWVRFFLVFAAFFISFNLLFAVLYWLSENSLAGTDGSFWQAFSFSVQTFSTVGYGAFSPKSDYAHTIMILESMLSVFVTAALTGLIFSKFSKPNARIIFTDKILINNFDGKRVLSFRMGNLRANQIAEAQVRVMALKSFVTPEGQTIRRQMDLNLVRSSSLFFALTWTVMHVIDESSPIYNMSAEDLVAHKIEFGVSVIGYDSSFSQTVHVNGIYAPLDVVFDRYFEDVFDVVDGNVTTLHYERFNNLKPIV